MTMQLELFLQKYFQGLTLHPPLFYSWEPGIRFELADPSLTLEDARNQRRIEKRAFTLFDSVFENEDDLFMVKDFHCPKGDVVLQKRPLRFHKKYVKEHKALYRLKHRIVPSVYGEENDVTHRFIFPCRKNHIKYRKLLMAIAAEDSTNSNRLLKKPKYAYNVYFINVTKKIIFHMYDDRGCDVIAADKKEILYLYETYNEWILEYDREQIESVFR
ncbi:DUF3885 domain-containing protein [Pseudalkalibacillus sp. SCS-8]|uniref:DUF3885 domain-containing protein n=1 Tax=Pseudalkalibacillus nanhaiensis TaxID=3115291 RepID=UPI0032DBD6D6